MTQARRIRITMLNSMAAGEIAEALDRHVEWGVELLDLKDALFDKAVMDLTDDEAARVAQMAHARGLSVYCMSTHLFYDDVERGEKHFETNHLGRVDRAVELARILRPRFVRLLAATGETRGTHGNCMDYLHAGHRWVLPMYGQAVDRIGAGGFQATIENEVGQCIFRTPGDVTGFFAELGRREKVCFTWDVQNLWQMGTFPTVEACDELSDLIGYLHLKGGRCEAGDGERAIAWRSSLAEASWPVVEITRRVLARGRCDVICLNPSHGRPPSEGARDDYTKADLDFIRSQIEEIAR